MTIAIIGKFYTEAFGLHLAEAINEQGYKVIRLDPEINLPDGKVFPKRMRNISKTLYQQVFYKLPTVRRFSSRKLYSRMKEQSIDLTISLHDFLSREEVVEIKRITKSPVCIWFPDALSNFQKSMFFYAGYDFLFFKDRYLVKQLREELRLNTFYLPQCCNPDKHKPVNISPTERESYGCDITNAGNLYPSRAALLSQLLVDYKIKLWGNLPPIWLNAPEFNSIVMGKLVFNEEKAKAFGAAKVVLNNLHPAEIDGVNKRTYEVPACGGFQITNYKSCTNELFDIDKEIVCYSSFEDLKEKLDYYIDDRNKFERQEIIDAGRNRVLNEHTYKHRLNKILNIVFN